MHRQSLGWVRSVAAVTACADRADEEVAVRGRRSAHHEGIEAPAFLGVHRGIDPQRGCRAFASHASTLSRTTDTDTDRPRRVAECRVHRLIGSRAQRRVERRAVRT